MNLKETPMKTFYNAKLVNSRRSYSKHILLSTTIAANLLQHYLTKILFSTNYIRHFFLFFLLFISSSSFAVIIIPSSLFSFFTVVKDTYHMNYVLCVYVSWIMSTVCLGIPVIGKFDQIT